eukprot:75881-Alexandrium_andersonii.AAC.1
MCLRGIAGGAVWDRRRRARAFRRRARASVRARGVAGSATCGRGIAGGNAPGRARRSRRRPSTKKAAWGAGRG